VVLRFDTLGHEEGHVLLQGHAKLHTYSVFRGRA
jgi:hypothetical protein